MERIVGKKKGIVLDFTIRECATLVVPKKQMGNTEMTQITIRVLEKYKKVIYSLYLNSLLLTKKKGYTLRTMYGQLTGIH